MSSHTPLPWRLMPEEVDRPYIRIRGTQLGCRYKIANVLTPIYDGVHSREADETRANAALIFKSVNLLPELQTALERIAKLEENTHEAFRNDLAVNIAKDILSKLKQEAESE